MQGTSPRCQPVMSWAGWGVVVLPPDPRCRRGLLFWPQHLNLSCPGTRPISLPGPHSLTQLSRVGPAALAQSPDRCQQVLLSPFPAL